MPKFVLADNSLAPAGGHHFEFAEAILSQAEEAGYQPIIGANLQLAEDSELARRWTTHQVFPFNVYHDYNLFYLQRWEEKEAKRKTVAWRGPLRPLSNLCNDVASRLRKRRWPVKRAACGKQFLNGCRELFQRVALEPGDIVMLPTVSDLELEMLGRYFCENSRTATAQWHLYFHNNFLIGREPQYDAQKFRLAMMQRSLNSCLEAGKHHDLRFYATTHKLADQFRRLKGCPEFRRLTFPVREALRAAAPEIHGGPKRVVCAGGFREERGQFSLAEIVRDVWADLLSARQIELHVQRSDPQWTIPLPDLSTAGQASSATPVIYHPHPLSAQGYNDLVRGAHIGLLLHDARSYYTRLSAVFQEYLCAGVPMIVPADCWMGDELAKGVGAGLAYSQRSDIPRLLREMMADYSRFRRDAQDKSPDGCRRLRPEVTWSELCIPRVADRTTATARHAA